MIALEDVVYRQIVAHAEDEYPHEVCGFVLRYRSLQLVLRCTNIQDELHVKDPIRWPRTRLTGYTMAPADMVRMLEYRAQGATELAVYHSHPDGTPVLSEEDILQAKGRRGVPCFPEALWLVAAPRNAFPGAWGIGRFLWDGQGFRMEGVEEIFPYAPVIHDAPQGKLVPHGAVRK